MRHISIFAACFAYSDVGFADHCIFGSHTRGSVFAFIVILARLVVFLFGHTGIGLVTIVVQGARSGVPTIR